VDQKLILNGYTNSKWNAVFILFTRGRSVQSLELIHIWTGLNTRMTFEGGLIIVLPMEGRPFYHVHKRVRFDKTGKESCLFDVGRCALFLFGL